MLTLIDGNSLLFRAYYGVRARLSRSDGTPTGAVYGFFSMILPVLAAAKPDDIVVCVFDATRKNFRNDIYPEYKANRGDTPEDLIAQLELVRSAARSMGMPVLSIPDVEADDVIATLSKQFCTHDGGTRIITSDKDLMQLVSNCIFLYDGMKEQEIREPGVFEKFGVRPDQVIDAQSLIGDSSDNVPGIPGIGPKKAAELINKFGTLDELYKNINSIENERIRNLLINNEHKARISKQLVTLKTDVDLNGLTLSPFKFNVKNALNFVRNEIESNSLATRIEKLFPSETELNTLTTDEKFEVKNTHQQKPISKYKIINSEQELDEFLSTIKDVLALDTETTGLNQMEDKIVGISMASDSSYGIYIPIRHKNKPTSLFDENEAVLPTQLSIDTVKQKLWPYLINPNIIKVGHNLKYDLHILENENWDTKAIAPIDDTMLLSYVLHGSLHSHGLDDLAKIYLDHENISFSSLFESKTQDKHFDELDIDIAAPYAAEDSYVCFALYELFKPQLDKNEKFKKLYESCDLPLLQILLKIERAGVLIDKSKLQQLSKIFHEQLTRLEKEIWDIAGHDFNIASPKQLGTVLFDELKLSENKKRSTDADTLNELADSHPVIEKVLGWRSIAKLAGTYADALPRQIGRDGRIHTTYLQTSTNTGRLSSRDPNLQNIPIKTELGEEIRKCFIAPVNKVLISADYSQIQLRLLADVADVKMFKETFQNGFDIHEQTARKIFGVADGVPVPKDLRGKAKTVNFSIIYGISSFGLAAQLNVSRTEAQNIINSYMAGLPEIKEYMEETKQFATQHACVYTPWGRRIELPEIKNPRLRSYALRAAINAPIQGFEADLMRLAMINIDKKPGNNSNIKMIMQVHDEMVFECDRDMAEEFAKQIKFEMENVAKLSVPLLAEYNIDTTWGK
ncbi:MAG: DNA polymerase I [Alphaproteobacteria bacterium]|nr:DNA polymerase I [Alphaproteobacteria bacterium]MBN2675056.1 DNA polymerase I [Alphaproteobacteria bacterium]